MFGNLALTLERKSVNKSDFIGDFAVMHWNRVLFRLNQRVKKRLWVRFEATG